MKTESVYTDIKLGAVLLVVVVDGRYRLRIINSGMAIW
jgi:hypothetical protein